jgi:hypothetical protein
LGRIDHVVVKEGEGEHVEKNEVVIGRTRGGGKGEIFACEVVERRDR